MSNRLLVIVLFLALLTVFAIGATAYKFWKESRRAKADQRKGPQ